MELLSKDNPRKQWLLITVNVLASECGLQEKDQVLMVMQLNTEEKIDQFARWFITRVQEKEKPLTPVEIMNQTARIGRLVPDEEEDE